jgi:ABC-type transport system substrate-binding protein
VTTSTSSTASTTTANEPQYGGTLTVFNYWGNGDPSDFDAQLTQQPWKTSVWDEPFLEWLVVGNVEQYGPRGNNAFAFQEIQVVPEQYLGGGLADSWEITTNPLAFTFHIHKGIMWTGNTKIGMAPRELIADDVVASNIRANAAPMVANIFTFVKDIHATDRYTVVWDLNSFDALWSLYMSGSSGCIMAPESIKAGAADWTNAVGTGPFIITDYTSGAECTYTRNKNYWGKTTINGKEYQLPFVNTLVFPIIPDESAEIANLRTGKIDWWPNVPTTYASSLKSSSPDLVQNNYLSGNVQVFRMNRIDSQYLKIKEVRQALMMATDLQTISNLVYGGGPIYSWPVAQGDPAYTPLQDLPASTQALFTYDTTKAQQMLADAGFPSGFTTTITVKSDAVQQDIATLVAGDWAKVGVKASIITLDPTAFTATWANRSYTGVIAWTYSAFNPLASMGNVDPTGQAATYAAGEPFIDMWKKADQETDPVARSADEKQEALALMDDVGWIPFADPYSLNCYWPWIKNYYNEVEAGYINYMPMINTMWIDPNVKKNLGYQ